MNSEQVLRHPNGGGQKVGSEVHVSADSFCNHVSQIRGNSVILTSTILDAVVIDSHLFNSTLEFSHVGHSVIAESVVGVLSAWDCVLHRVKIGNSGIRQFNRQILLKEVVAENCELYGNWTLKGNARISCGVWHRAPRFKRITGENGVDVGLTESIDQTALMACWRKPIKTWLKAGPRLGQKHLWTSLQILEAKDFFTELLDCPLEGVS